MRPLIGLFLIVALAEYAYSQPDSVRPVTLRHTQIHVGFGTQALGYVGMRQFVGDRLFLEGSLGGRPGILFTKDLFSHTLGVGIIPESTKYKQGLCYSLLYSFVSDTFFGADRQYQHILTANIGYLYQHETGVSFLGRGGIGLTKKTLGDKHGIFPWFNMEFSMGYAF